jgi:hypothetical protein
MDGGPSTSGAPWAAPSSPTRAGVATPGRPARRPRLVRTKCALRRVGPARNRCRFRTRRQERRGARCHPVQEHKRQPVRDVLIADGRCVVPAGARGGAGLDAACPLPAWPAGRASAPGGSTSRARGHRALGPRRQLVGAVVPTGAARPGRTADARASALAVFTATADHSAMRRLRRADRFQRRGVPAATRTTRR